ncbi:MAG: biosynthetic-type acetolactate synthase large subunit [Fusobacteriaceae bacterium]
MEMNGAKIILESLRRLGVTDVFGYPGGSVIPLYDALYDFKGLKHYLARHEQGAIHAADGYARTKNTVGVCIATSGPGATNLITGIMTAQMDSVPIVAITGQVIREALGKDSFQETDVIGLTSPITKHNYLVKTIEELPHIIKEAYAIAKHGRPGSVVIDIPKDIQQEKISFEKYEELFAEEIPPINKFVSKYTEKDISDFKEMILASKKPLFILGGGILSSGSVQEVLELLKRINAPCVTTLMGMGIIPTGTKGYLGMIGMHGFYYANKAVNESDLIISLGMRFDDRIVGNKKAFAKNAKKIHVDIDEAEIAKAIVPDLGIIGDLKEVLTKLLATDLKEDFSDWKNSHLNEAKEKENELSQYSVIKFINKFADENTIVVTDVGQHQMFTAQHFHFKKPYTFCSSSGAGTMGYGLPAAIGAQVANPDKKVIAIIGDGGFQMTLQELILLRQYKLPVKIIILNNGVLGMVRQWQELFHNKRFSEIDLSVSPDFSKIGEAYGIKSFKIEDISSIQKLEEALKSDEPILVDVVVSPEFNVYPIIPPGKSIMETLGGDTE